MINVILVDDHSLFRLGEKGILEKCPDIGVVGEAGDGKTLFHLLETTPADLILLDISLPDMSGIEVARRLKTEYPQIKILVLSVENSIEVIRQLVDIGIHGFISKQQATDDELPEAIRAIINGSEFFGRDITHLLYNIYISKNKVTKQVTDFTHKELEIIELCRQGFIGKEIAARQNISLRTVDAHKRNIFRKLGINNTMEMVQYAVKNGIIMISD
jgi:DNA-binding NarL/FixJ family response regulator